MVYASSVMWYPPKSLRLVKTAQRRMVYAMRLGKKPHEVFLHNRQFIILPLLMTMYGHSLNKCVLRYSEDELDVIMAQPLLDMDNVIVKAYPERYFIWKQDGAYPDNYRVAPQPSTPEDRSVQCLDLRVDYANDVTSTIQRIKKIQNLL